MILWVVWKPDLIKGRNRGWMWAYLVWAALGTAAVKNGAMFPLMVGCVSIGLAVLGSLKKADFKFYVRVLGSAAMFFILVYLKSKWKL